MEIREALEQVDALDKDNFTSDGSVKVDVVSKIMGRSVTRQEILDAAPAFNIDNPKVETTEEAKNAEGLKDPITNGELNDTEPKEVEGGDGTVPAQVVNDTDPKSAGHDQERPDPIKKPDVDVIKGGKVIDGDTVDPGEEIDMEDIDVSSLRDYQERGPMGERDFASFMQDVPADNLDGLEEMLLEQKDEIEQRLKEMEELRDNVRRSLAMTRSRIKRERPDVSNQEAIRAFIQSQNEQRSKRADKAAQVRSIVDINDLDPRSGIDRAMARNTKRGTKRPTKI